MTLAKQIEQKLNDAFNPTFLNIIDQSYQHIGHSGNDSNGIESHFKVEIASPLFEGCSKLKRHQQVNDVLKDEIAQLHAISFEIRS